MNRTDMEQCRWHAFSDELVLQQAACKIILDCATLAIHQRGQFLIVLAGGNTPRGTYNRLCQSSANWPAWHIYFGDERCLPLLDPARNSSIAAMVWLDCVPIPASQLHTIPAELGPIRAAQMYAETLQTVGEFDLVMLGLGDDGHTASLFPDHEWGTAPRSPDVLAVFDAPKPPPQRVSLSAVRLSRARQVMFLIGGESKQRAVTAWRVGMDIPARAIRPGAGVDVLVMSALLAPLDGSADLPH